MKKRILHSIAIGFVFTILFIWGMNMWTQSQKCLCTQEFDTTCKDYHAYTLLKFENGCHCHCVSLKVVITQFILFGLVPFIGFSSVGWYLTRKVE